ncbi:IS3 family transposase [Sulfitobacter sp. EhC04]|uniref:IS3 family transposase n=1 Tax=Sulfitobacter sp. EhC04 TaxID=1849168 RepID=UPI0009EF19FF|nr:IS3 family transposase [Sulfitobacter sp. EhC04]
MVDEAQVKDLNAKIGELAVANDASQGLRGRTAGHGPCCDVQKAQALGRDVRRGMIDREHPDLSVGQQCRLLSLSRSSFYYRPAGEAELNLGLMRLIDEQFLETPFYGVRQMARHLCNEGHAVNDKRVRRLMGLMPIYQTPNTSRPAKGHKRYPYLLRGLRVERPNQVLHSGS